MTSAKNSNNAAGRVAAPRLATLGALATSAVLLLALAGPAAAATGPKLVLDAYSNSTVPAGSSGFQYSVDVTNVGGSATDGSPIELTATLPSGVTALSVGGSFECGEVAGETVLHCSFNGTVNRGASGSKKLLIEAAVAPGAEGVLTATYEVSGGGSPSPPTSADPVRISPNPPPFGIDAFDAKASAGESGALDTAAATHPYDFTTSFDFNTTDTPAGMAFFTPGPNWPVEPLKTVEVALPPGFLGNTAVAGRCALSDLAHTKVVIPEPLCEPSSQVGSADIGTTPAGPTNSSSFRPVPIFSLVPPPGVPARFGFNLLGTIVVFDATVRNGSDYGLTIVSRNTPEGLAVGSVKTTFWGVPSDPSHESERTCPGVPGPLFGGEVCASDAPPRPFFRNPTSCQGPLPYSLAVDSWEHPGAFEERTTESHQGPGYPFPEEEGGARRWGDKAGIEGCADVRFRPELEASPTTNAADSPSGLDLHLRVPQDCWEHQEETCQSDLKDAEVKLPQGMTLNPSAANGLGSCGESEVGYKPGTTDPFEFSPDPANCPDDSKIGDVTITTPLLEHDLKGAVYLAKQGDNPLGSLLAMYLVAEGEGVVVKQAGEIESGPGGRLTTVFKGAPQTPFSDLHVQLYGGPRAALRTPPTCGEYATQAKLTPWSGTGAVDRSSLFQITNCPNSGFNPKLTAGTQNPLAASYSPFTLRLTREDGTQELGGISLGVPDGLLANLKGIPYCSDAVLASISGAEGTGRSQERSPSCPAASQVGTVTVGAGAGPQPFYTQAGRAYWAGPYKGAPVSLAVVVPAVAGPFDLGSVVVRNGFYVNPETAKITAVSDPFPTSLHGIPLDLRDIRIDLNRPNYTLNPTSCDPMAFEAQIASAQGASAARSERFQVGGCDRLAFGPKLSLRLKGATKRAGNPALSATLTMPQGGANIASASVALPGTEFLDQAHIKTICTRVQYAAGAGGGAQCPPGSVYGYAAAYSPILDYYLQGPVYLRSSSHNLPDLVASLGGQIHIDVIGRIDSFHKGIRTTFATVPDAPVSKFVLTMKGAKKGLLENSVDVCANPQRASAEFSGQNAKVKELRPLLKAGCGAARGKKSRGHQ